MSKKSIYSELFPLIDFAIVILINVLVQLVVLPFIMSVLLPSESFYYPFFILSLLFLLIISIPYFFHQVSNMKIRKEGKVSLAQVVGKSKFRNIEGESTYFHAVGSEDNKEFDFHLQIYPFTKTKIGNSYVVHYSGLEKKNKCYIMEDERILSKLYYSYTVFHFCVSVVISFLM